MTARGFAHFFRSLFDDDVWIEIGKAVAYAIPVAMALSIFYQWYPPALLYLSGTPDSATLADVFAHAFAAAGIAGFVYAMVKKHKVGPLFMRRHVMLTVVVITAVLIIPIWEYVEQLLRFVAIDDYKKDIVSDFSGIFAYIGLEALRRRLRNRKTGKSTK